MRLDSELELIFSPTGHPGWPGELKSTSRNNFIVSAPPGSPPSELPDALEVRKYYLQPRTRWPQLCRGPMHAEFSSWASKVTLRTAGCQQVSSRGQREDWRSHIQTCTNKTFEMMQLHSSSRIQTRFWICCVKNKIDFFEGCFSYYGCLRLERFS